MIILSAVAIGATSILAVGAARLVGEEAKTVLPAEFTDVSGISSVEVRDASGRVILQGTLGAPADDDDGEVERKATLAAKDGSSASGEAEVEFGKSGSVAATQEVEVSVEKLAVSTIYTVHLDGRQAASFTTDDNGKAEVELASASAR
jgi:hypothetical protein